MSDSPSKLHATGVNFFEQGRKLMASHSYETAINAFEIARERGQRPRECLEYIRDCYNFLDLPQLAAVFQERLELMDARSRT
ncbi:MAG: hypothetical protein ACOCZ8_00505 [Bacteroidota bacterium]